MLFYATLAQRQYKKLETFVKPGPTRYSQALHWPICLASLVGLAISTGCDVPAVFGMDSTGSEEGSDSDASGATTGTLRAALDMQRHQLALRANKVFLPEL